MSKEVTVVATENGLAIYDSMVVAIDRCYQVDEVKDLRDKAMAFEIYARQAMNVDAERKAVEVRIRAERRAGQLLREMKRSPVSDGGNSGKNQHGEYKEAAFDAKHPPLESEYAQAKKDANISNDQAFRWQKLAEMPREDFEGKLQDPLIKPTTAGLLNTDSPRPAPNDALALWGWVKDFEKHIDVNTNINEIVGKLSDAVGSDVRRITPIVLEWLGELK